MSNSMREQFQRRGLEPQVISLRHALGNHLGGAAIGLRAALERFDRLASGNGFECGCRRPESKIVHLGFKQMEAGGVVPSWVDAGDPRDHRHRPRTLEGVLIRSSITKEDFPLKPWHSSFDWNLFVEVDRQYRYLVSPGAAHHHRQKLPPAERHRERVIIECEWETAFLPLWAIPSEGSRVWITGRWIFDCGHPGSLGHSTEIHPPKAVVSFRGGATKLEGNAQRTRANQAVIYIGRRGGYINQDITDQDYVFDLPLPPRPHPAAEPRVQITPMIRPFPVAPIVAPFPAVNPRCFRVTVPLSRVTEPLEEYGAIVAAGWSDPDGAEARAVKRFRVRFELLDGRGTPEPPSDDTWDFCFGVNGRWHRRQLTSDRARLDVVEDVSLHESDTLQITACGMARRKIASFMGQPSSVARRLISNPVTDAEQLEGVEGLRDAFLRASALLGPPKSEGSAALRRFSKVHRPVRPGSFRERASANPGLSFPDPSEFDYGLEYTIEEL